MKTIITITITTILALSINAQTIKCVSAYDNNYDSSSGIFGITDHGVYEYSWYYEEWLQLPNTGLTFIEGEAKIDEISAFDANSVNPSGVYVISDTAVYVYNYYAELWYDLSNTGLCRIEGVVQMSDLSAHLDVEDDYENIFVVSCDHVYYYDWYQHLWHQLPNDGLSVKQNTLTEGNFENNIFPNPVDLNSIISFNLPDAYNGKLEIAIFDNNGKFIKEIVNDYVSGGTHEINISGEGLLPGIYFYEISGVNFSQAKKFIKL